MPATGDTNVMPDHIADLIIQRLGRAGAMIDRTYGGAVRAVQEDPDPFVAILTS